MKKMLAAVPAVAALVLGPLAGTAAAAENGGGQPPRHGHMLILGLELDVNGEPVGFRKCVDLAGGNALPLNAHHRRVHMGTAGQALFEHAGHAVAPTAPLWPEVSGCEDLEAMLGGGGS